MMFELGILWRGAILMALHRILSLSVSISRKSAQNATKVTWWWCGVFGRSANETKMVINKSDQTIASIVRGTVAQCFFFWRDSKEKKKKEEKKRANNLIKVANI